MTFSNFFKNFKLYGFEYFSKYYGTYRGFVADNEDPKFLGRLKVEIPQVYGDKVRDYWAWPKGMFAGDKIGFWAIPNPKDGVWITFENGDPRFPIWEYGWFAEGEVPESAKVDGNKPKNMVWQSTSKHRIELDDHNELVRITDSHGNVLEMNENGISKVTDNISLGSLDGSKEPAVLGDTAHDLLKEFRDDIGNLTAITTSSGITGKINTSPQWAALVAKWDTKWGEFKSNVVTLD